MDDLIKWYINYDSFSKEEAELLDIPRKDNPLIVDEDTYSKLCQCFFNKMPFCNISAKDRFLVFDDSGTKLINDIFEKEVDDETLVISTTYEHGSVQKCLKNSKNVLYLDLNKEINAYNFSNVIKESRQYKKVFVYIIGTQLSTGEITPQLFFEELKQCLIANNVTHKIMIDDVHGMFLLPRDYRMFDYILYTAHSLVPAYDMGMLISKTDDFGIKAYNWGNEYLKRLTIVLSKRQKMAWFKNLMIQYFNKLIADTNTFSIYNKTVDHIFSIWTKGLFYTNDEWNKLDEYRIRVSEHKTDINFIRIRFQEFSRLSDEKAVEGLHCLLKIVNRALLKKQMREA